MPSLYESVRSFDPLAERIVSTEDCEWVRTSFAIVGLIDADSAKDLTEASIRSNISKSYAQLDELPNETLSVQDLWNLILFIHVPYRREQVDRQTAQLLLSIVNDTSGSRKVILWSDGSPAQHLSPLGEGQVPWLPSSKDPLRETITNLSRDQLERDALAALFKRRISDTDIDNIVNSLEREIEK